MQATQNCVNGYMLPMYSFSTAGNQYHLTQVHQVHKVRKVTGLLPLNTQTCEWLTEHLWEVIWHNYLPSSFLNTNTHVFFTGVDGRDGTAGLPGKHAQPLRDWTLCPTHFFMNTLRITPRIQVYPVNQVSICTCPLKSSIRNNNPVNEYFLYPSLWTPHDPSMQVQQVHT